MSSEYSDEGTYDAPLRNPTLRVVGADGARSAARDAGRLFAAELSRAAAARLALRDQFNDASTLGPGPARESG